MLFWKVGEFKGELQIKIKPDAKPFAQTVPRNVPGPRINAFETELQKFKGVEIIESILEPKDVDKIRVCVDCTKLNEESKLSKIGNTKYFSKKDLN